MRLVFDADSHINCCLLPIVGTSIRSKSIIVFISVLACRPINRHSLSTSAVVTRPLTPIVPIYLFRSTQRTRYASPRAPRGIVSNEVPHGALNSIAVDLRHFELKFIPACVQMSQSCSVVWAAAHWNTVAAKKVTHMARRSLQSMFEA
jgi:hypothetical protein